VRHCDDARFVWNLAVEQQSWWRPGRVGPPGAAERQRQLAEARAAEPWLAGGSSSVQQQCRVCGHIAWESRESQALFRCVACGHADHADANAARNILARGLASIGVPAHAPGHGAHARIRRRVIGAAGTTRSAA